MCWNPYDAEGGMSRTNFNSEKPYSVGDIKIDRTGIDETTAADEGGVGNTLMGFTIKDLGRQSGELTRMSKGDWLALRGPFGTTFPTPESGSTLILVSGGIGSTPMHMMAKEARNKLGGRVNIHAIMGFRNASEAHYVQRMEGLCDSLTITTDDGTQGIHGYPTQPLEELLQGVDSDNCTLLTCGPEPMMKPVLEMAVTADIECYAAMERYLPCAIAVCGLCMVGDRLTCRQGPVMEGGWLLQQSDFGHHHG
jgi:dihydroorotate dehydrogenase electron transfer subunit